MMFIWSVLCKCCAHGNIRLAQCVFKVTFVKTPQIAQAQHLWSDVWECSEWLFSLLRKVFWTDVETLWIHTLWTPRTLSRPPPTCNYAAGYKTVLVFEVG